MPAAAPVMAGQNGPSDRLVDRSFSGVWARHPSLAASCIPLLDIFQRELGLSASTGGIRCPRVKKRAAAGAGTETAIDGGPHDHANADALLGRSVLLLARRERRPPLPEAYNGIVEVNGSRLAPP